MIYLVWSEGTPFFKVGFTRGEAKARIAGMQTGCPHNLRLISFVEGDEITEKSLHKILKPLATRGEWFDFRLWPKLKKDDQLFLTERFLIGIDTATSIEAIFTGIRTNLFGMSAPQSEKTYVWEAIKLGLNFSLVVGMKQVTDSTLSATIPMMNEQIIDAFNRGVELAKKCPETEIQQLTLEDVESNALAVDKG